MLPGLAVSGRSLHGPQRTDQLLTAGRQFVEHLARELGDLSDPRVGRRRLNGTLVELPGTVPVTAQRGTEMPPAQQVLAWRRRLQARG
jgi:hypothetical protein